MSGSIVVLNKDKSIPSADTTNKAADAEKTADVAKLLPDYTRAKAGQFPLPAVKNVAGYASQAFQQGLIDEMIPAEIDAKVGQKVTWTVVGPHTISFGKAPVEPGAYMAKSPDGAWHLNQQVFAPSNFPQAPPPPGGPPPSQPTLLPPIEGGTYDGTGFKSTGALVSFPPVLTQASITFTKAGTYSYVCLIHPKMGGVVKVT